MPTPHPLPDGWHAGPIVPCRVIFADSAGLKLKFERQITDKEFSELEALFPMEFEHMEGLERYVSVWGRSSPR